MLLNAANCAGSLIICWAIALALVGAAWAGTVASMVPATPRATIEPARAFLEAAMLRMTDFDTEGTFRRGQGRSPHARGMREPLTRWRGVRRAGGEGPAAVATSPVSQAPGAVAKAPVTSRPRRAVPSGP